MITEVTSFVLCFTCAMLQLGVLDYYFIYYTGNGEIISRPIFPLRLNVTLTPLGYNYAWLGWIGGDLLVAAVMTWLLVKAVRYNDRCSKTVCKSDANLQSVSLECRLKLTEFCTSMIPFPSGTPLSPG